MINHKQPGEPTYQRDKIIWTFEPYRRKELFKSFLKEYNPDLKIYNIKLNGLYFEVVIAAWTLNVSCYGDGWYITIKNLGKENKEKIFGSHNIEFVWTQQTDKVVDIMRELTSELRKL